jgi:Ca2+-binding RTX toxin-like protein
MAITGTTGADRLNGVIGKDTEIDGGDGADTITGNTGNDTITGGTGNDILAGGAGVDTYVYRKGDGSDKIDTGTGAGTAGAVDKLVLDGINFADVRLSHKGADLFIDIGTDRITVANWYATTANAANNRLASIQFDDKTMSTDDITKAGLSMFGTAAVDTLSATAGWDNTIDGGAGNDNITGNAGADTLSGGDGNDTVSGGAGADIITGGKGNDALAGGAGTDTYVYRKGDGSDKIDAGTGAGTEGAVDKLVLDGINFAEATISHKGADLCIDIGTDRITVANWFATAANAANNRLATIEFADKTIDTAAISKLGEAMYGTAGADTLTATAGISNTIDGGAGNDNITGGTGADTLSGGDGNDTINGGAGADAIVGGKGNDTLAGGAGADTYTYRAGDGNDRIDVGTGAGTEGAIDKLVMDGINFADARISHGGSDLYLDIGTERVTIANWYAATKTAGTNQLASIEFADKTVTTAELSKLGLAMFGTAGADTLKALNDDDTTADGGAGNDNIAGGAGNDKLCGGAGNDAIDGGAGNDQLEGGAGVDNIKGGAGDDTIIGGADSDILAGGAGADTYVYRAGDGNDKIDVGMYSGGGASVDKLVMDGINAADVKFSHTGSDLNIDYAGARITVANWFSTAVAGSANRLATIDFADKSLTTNEISKMGLTVDGTSAADRISALDGWDNFITGGGGNDALSGGTGNDSLAGGDGNDNILGGAGNDKLDGGDGNDNIKGDAGNDTITGGAGADIIAGGDGNDVIDGGADADTIDGGTGDDIISGGAGNDVLSGGDGADTYIYHAGDGSDKINAATGATKIGSFDKLVMDGINSADVKVGHVNNDLVLDYAGEHITITNWYNPSANGANSRLDSIEFADKTIGSAELSKMGLVSVGTDGVDKMTALTGWDNDMAGGNGNDVLIGSTGNDKLSGDAGNDTITAGAGNDTVLGGDGNDNLNGEAGNDNIKGGAGNDVLKGEAGDDVITGGLGNDTMTGGAGADTYIISKGDGADRIDAGTDAGNIKTAVDHLVFTDVKFADAKFSHSGADLFIDSGTDRVTVANWFNTANTDTGRLADVTFADGKVLTTAQVTSYGLDVVGTDGADVLKATTGYANLMHGGAGNDVITGASGDDMLFGGLGNDTLNGGAGDDTYVVLKGEGVDRIADTSGYDTIDFGNMALAEARFVKSGTGLDIYAGAEQLVHIDVQLVGNPAIEQFNFGGQSHGWSEIKGLMV